MRAVIPYRLWSVVLGSTLACGGASTELFDDQADEARDIEGFVAEPAPGRTALKAGTVASLFPGAGTSGAARSLSPGLGPETSSECDPQPLDSEPVGATGVQTVCFFGQDEAETPAAAIEQVVEIVGNEEWVHIRLTLNPDFVDNSYGENAIGWESRAGGPGPAGREPKPPKEPRAGDGEPRPPRGGAEAPAAGAEPPPPPEPPSGDAEPPAAGAEPPPPPEPPSGDLERPAPPPPREPMARPEPAGKAGHTFRDLVGSDHAEMVLLDAAGSPVLHFRLDYLSAAAEQASGFASLGVAGGEGRMELGLEPSILASTTSLDRNLNACGLTGFTESSPATDLDYTPNPDASAWDFRVSYDLWVATEAFGDAGFGSALIENVHASPSKAGRNTIEVEPAPCPLDPDAPDQEPQPLPPVLTVIR